MFCRKVKMIRCWSFQGPPPSAEQIVTTYRNNGNKLGVPEMRKYMKTLVLEIFFAFEDKYSDADKCKYFHLILKSATYLKIHLEMEWVDLW